MDNIKQKAKSFWCFATNMPGYYWILVGCVTIAFSHVPYLILGEQSFVIVHDNLDAIVPQFTLLAKTGLRLDGSLSIDTMMNGLSVRQFPSKVSVVFLFFALLPPFVAYLLNEFVVKVIAFCGMFLLLEKHVLKEKNYPLAFVVSAMFCFLPFYSMFGLSSSGIPLVFWAFWSLSKREHKWYHYVAIALFGFYSLLVLSGAFVIAVLAIACLLHGWHTKKINMPFVTGLAVLCLVYVVSNVDLINIMFFSSDYVSHRSVHVQDPAILSAHAKKTIGLLLNTHYHTGSMKTLGIILSLLTSLFLVRRDATNGGSRLPFGVDFGVRKGIPRKLWAPLALIAFVLLVFFAQPFINDCLGGTFKILRAFNYGRFYFLLPAVWLVVLAISLELLIRKKFQVLVVLFVLLQVTMIARQNRFYRNNLLLCTDRISSDNTLTYGNYFDTELFSDIDRHIGREKSSYRIVSLGMHPSVSLMNGFYTLDGYHTNYALDYKLQFRELIEDELAKCETIRKYFDNWGSRCYIFSSELGRSFTFGKEANIEVSELKLNTQAFQAMGGEYVFSAVKIKNAEEIHLRLDKVFETDSSYWRIYLYRLNLPRLEETVPVAVHGGGN